MNQKKGAKQAGFPGILLRMSEREKPKPKNHALLVAKAKKARNKGKIIIRCDKCGKIYTDNQQLKDHKKSHGS